METTSYKRKPLIVQAVQVTDDNLYEVAKWCGGDVVTAANGKKNIQVAVLHPLHAKQSRANVGDWLLKSTQGFKIYADSAFQKGFELAQAPVPNLTTNATEDAKHSTEPLFTDDAN